MEYESGVHRPLGGHKKPAEGNKQWNKERVHDGRKRSARNGGKNQGRNNGEDSAKAAKGAKAGEELTADDSLLLVCAGVRCIHCFLGEKLFEDNSEETSVILE